MVSLFKHGLGWALVAAPRGAVIIILDALYVPHSGKLQSRNLARPLVASFS
jgi:hypothetical protein